VASWRGFIEWVLPWYDARREQMRNARTERVIRRSKVARLRSRLVIAEYREAASDLGRSVKAADRAGEAVINELDHDR
jgi:hypothetical protein